MNEEKPSVKAPTPSLVPKDFSTDQEVRWCPGCGDYSILKQVQTILPEIGVPRENIVFISGIGCSSRFPYYMETFGMHGIHGRATAIASGLKSINPELSVWVITGDGDSLSIGGNHLIHILRRNFDLNILLFNNEIYGLTKGQYSPTSPRGSVSKSTPMGSVDHPFNPLALALGAEGSFISRTMDRDPKHLRDTLLEAEKHKGTSFIEIYQNCNVFNDGAFSIFTEKESKADMTLFLHDGEPLIFGQQGEKCITLHDFKPKVEPVIDGVPPANVWYHDPSDKMKAGLLTQFFEDPRQAMAFPRPFGVFYKEERFLYEDLLHEQIVHAKEKKGPGDLDHLLRGDNFWTIREKA